MLNESLTGRACRRIKKSPVEGATKMISVKTCPSCGSRRIKKVKRDLTREFEGHTYVVPDLEFHECPDCGENVYDREAMRKIESHSPAFAKTHATK
jgi:YgiT-type zinc finger domain-containing protein